MTDAPTRTAALAAAVDDLTWCTTVPHRLGQIVGIYAETLAAQPLQFRHGATPTEMADAIKAHGASTGGRAKGTHSDPTFDAAFGHTPGAIDDGDGTLRAVDSAIALIGESASELDHDTAIAAGKPAPAARTARSRDDQLADALARLHRIRYHLEDAIAARPDQAEHWDELLRLRIADTARWLRTKAEAIWVASKGEHMPVAIQRQRRTCAICTPLGRDVVPERGDRCGRCRDFLAAHQGLRPTAKIARFWEDHPRTATPPRLIAEARYEQAQAKRSERQAQHSAQGA